MESNKQTYEEWSKGFEGKSDMEIADMVRDMIIAKHELDEDSVKVFNDTYDYIKRHIANKKDFSLNTLYIHLKDVKKYDMTKVNIFAILVLCHLCGLTFEINNE